MAATHPTHTAYQVRKYKSGKDEKSFWTKIGSVWAHNDSKGFNIRLNALPIDGEIVIRSVQERPAESQGDDAEGDNSIPT